MVAGSQWDGGLPVRPVVLFVALWAYASVFGLVALAGTRLLALVMDASGLRSAAQVGIMAAAALLGTYLSVPALEVARRLASRTGR